MNRGDAVMTEPDEALLWAREERVKFWEQSNASKNDIAMHVAAIRAGDYDRNLYDDVYRSRSGLDGYRAGAAASAERIKALEARVAELEAEFEGGPVCQPIVSKSDEPQTSDRAALEALILAVERDGHDGSHLEDDDGQNECPVCATVATIRAMREAL